MELRACSGGGTATKGARRKQRLATPPPGAEDTGETTVISHLHSPTGQQKKKKIMIWKREKTVFSRARKQDGNQFIKPQVEGGNPDVQTAPALIDPW